MFRSCRNCDLRSLRTDRICGKYATEIPLEFFDQYKNDCPDWIEEVPF